MRKFSGKREARHLETLNPSFPFRRLRGLTDEPRLRNHPTVTHYPIGEGFETKHYPQIAKSFSRRARGFKSPITY